MPLLTIPHHRSHRAACAPGSSPSGPHVFLRDHGFRIADQAAVATIMHVDVASLAAVDYAGNHLARLVLDIHENRRADGI